RGGGRGGPRRRDVGGGGGHPPRARHELALHVGREALGGAQALAEVLVALAYRELEAGDRPLGDLGGGDQLGDGRLERLLVGLEQLEALVEQDAVADGEREQDRDQAFDDQC